MPFEGSNRIVLDVKCVDVYSQRTDRFLEKRKGFVPGHVLLWAGGCGVGQNQ